MPDRPTPETLLHLLSDGRPWPKLEIESHFRSQGFVETWRVHAMLFELVDHGGYLSVPDRADVFEITRAGMVELKRLVAEREARERREARREQERKVNKQGALFA
jgi:hypothetical protein